MTAPARLAAEHTHRTLTAAMTAVETATTHRLTVVRVEAATGTLQRYPNGTTALVGEPVIVVHTSPAGFLGWCEWLGADQILLVRTTADMLATTGEQAKLGHLWTVRTAIPRSGSLTDAADLPGGRVPWQHARARIGRDRLAAALTARGLT